MWGLMQGEGAAENPAEVLRLAGDWWDRLGRLATLVGRGRGGGTAPRTWPGAPMQNVLPVLSNSSQSLPVSSVQVSCKEPHLPLHQIREI